MITNKGDDLKITLQESNIQKVRVFTTSINKYIEKIPKDNVVNISATELINSELKSGVIAYVCAKSSADSGFEDGKYDTTNVEYTDIYYNDINESYSTPEDEATKVYSDQLEAIKKDLTSKLNNKAEQKDLSNEVGDRKKAYTELKDLIDSKYSDITNGINDKILSKAEKKDLTDESTTRKAKDEELQRQLNDLQDSTSSINTKLNFKAEQSNLVNEVSDRKKADDDLQNKISSLQNKVQTDIEDKLYSKIERSDLEKETADRKTKDEDLQNQVNTLKTDTSELKTNDTQIQNYVDSYINNIMFYSSSDQSFDDFLSSHKLKKFYAYSTSKDGKENFSTTPFDNYSFIGAYIGNTQPTDYAKYNWKAAKKKEHTAYLSIGDLICNQGESFTLENETVVAYTNDKLNIAVKKLEAGTYTADNSNAVYSTTFSTDLIYSATHVGVYYDYSDKISEDPSSYHWAPIYEKTDGQNLALNTSDEWSGWFNVGDLNVMNATFSKKVQLCSTVQKDTYFAFSIEIEFKDIEQTTDASKEAFLLYQETNGGISGWTGKNYEAEDGVYYLKYTSKAVRTSDVFTFQFRCDYTTAKLRYRKLKVEYGTQPTPYVQNGLDLPKKYTISVKSGNDSYIAIDNKKLCDINDSGLSAFFIRYASEPQIVCGISGQQYYMVSNNIANNLSKYKDCVLVIVGFKKFDLHFYGFMSLLSQYGVNISDGKLSEMDLNKGSMVIICQKGLNKGEAYYQFDKDNPVEFTAQVNYGKLEPNKKSNDKKDIF